MGIEWIPMLIVGIITGLSSFAGAWGAVRTDMMWIKKELARHDRELAELRARR